MTRYTPPVFNLANPTEAASAARWVAQISALIPSIMRDGTTANSYSTIIGDIIDAGYGGDYKAKCRAFSEGAVQAGKPVYAECVHDLFLMDWVDGDDATYGRAINDLFNRAGA